MNLHLFIWQDGDNWELTDVLFPTKSLLCACLFAHIGSKYHLIQIDSMFPASDVHAKSYGLVF